MNGSTTRSNRLVATLSGVALGLVLAVTQPACSKIFGPSDPALSTQAVVLCTRAADTGFCPPGASGSNGRPSSPDPFPVGTATIHMSYRSRAPETDSPLQAIVSGPGGTSAVPLSWAAYPYENDKVAHVLVPPPGGRWAPGDYEINLAPDARSRIIRSFSFKIDPSAGLHP